MLKETPKNEGGRPTDKTGSTAEPVIPTLADFGLTKEEAIRGNAGEVSGSPPGTYQASVPADLASASGPGKG
jgi:hypothetical protein